MEGKKHKYKSYDKARRQDQVQSTNGTTTNNYEFSVGDKQDFSFTLAEKNPHPPGGKTASIDISLNTDGYSNDAENSRPPSAELCKQGQKRRCGLKILMT